MSLSCNDKPFFFKKEKPKVLTLLIIKSAALTAEDFGQHVFQILEFFMINDLAVSARSGRSKSEFNVFLSVDTWYLKLQLHSRTSLSPLLVFITTLYISTTSKNYNSYLPDLAETAKFLIAKN